MFGENVQRRVGRTRVDNEHFEAAIKVLRLDRREQASQIRLAVECGNKDCRIDATARVSRNHRHELGALPGELTDADNSAGREG